MPVRSMNTSKLRCETLPIPAEAKLSFCGTVREYSSNSFTVLTGTLLATTSADGETATPLIASYCVSGSNGDFDFL